MEIGMISEKTYDITKNLRIRRIKLIDRNIPESATEEKGKNLN